MNVADLEQAQLELVGRLPEASNAALLVRVRTAQTDGFGMYKPIRGERPLWDFPDGQLAYREVAAYLLSAAGGWDVVPPTVLRDGPLGPGSLQRWVTANPLAEPDEADPAPDATPGVGANPGADAQRGARRHRSSKPGPVPPAGSAQASAPAASTRAKAAQKPPLDVVLAPPRRVPAGYLPVLSAELANGRPIVIAHADTAELASVAVFDAVINNSDRQASHLLRDPDGRLWGVDHGVSLHTENKLRTVLWGWQGEALPAPDIERLSQLAQRLDARSDRYGLQDALAALLTPRELLALRRRIDSLLTSGVFPNPPEGWPSVPWPPL